jgi:UDP-glucose 4-epimerase
MKIIVTGALGHIGSKLIRKLPLAFPNSHIVIIDSLLTQRYASLFELPDQVKFTFVQADIVNDNIQEVFADVSVVIHLAAITDATNSFENAKIFEENNFFATKIIADICLKNKIPIISLSSTSVYGSQEDTVDENCKIENLKPQSPYAEIKLKEESYLKKLHIENGLKFITLRFGTIFGVSPGMRFHTAVNKFCWQAVMGSPLTVWKTALNQKRPYLDLEDAINSIIFLIRHNAYNSEIYNVVTCNATVKDIITIIEKNVKTLKVEYVDSKIMNQLSYNVLSKKILSKGFKSTGDLELGIHNTIKIIKNFNYKNKLVKN